MSSIPQLKQRLIKSGLQVFPCWIRYDDAKQKYLKGPAIPKGASWQTVIPNDPALDWSSGTVGIMVPQGLVIIDLDTQKGVIRADVEAFLGVRLNWDAALIQKTPSGGAHYAFRTHQPIKQRSDWIVGFDTRTAGQGFICSGNLYAPAGNCGPYALTMPHILPELPHCPAIEVVTVERVETPMPTAETRDVDMLIAALHYVDPTTRDAWLKVGMALRNHYHDNPEAGFALFDAWSRGEYWPDGSPPSYNPDTQEQQWASFKAEKDGREITIRSVYYIAVNGGWKPPRCIDTAAAFRRTGTEWQMGSYSLTSEPGLSHDELALELSKAGFKDNARFVPDWGKWVFWNGQRWEVDSKLRHMTETRAFLRQKSTDVIEWGKFKASQISVPTESEAIIKLAKRQAKALKQNDTINSVISIARSNEDLATESDQFDNDLMLFGTPLGTVDLNTGRLIQAKREHWITKHCAVTPTSRDDAPIWFDFLNKIFDGDLELIAFLQRACGYALTGQTTEHKLLFLFGTGSNGKSVFLNTISGIMGNYAKHAPATTFLNTATQQHPTDLAGLKGARLVAGSELPAGRVWNESVVKDLTGGDKITARFMRQDFFEYRPQFTLFIAGNHRPSFNGIDEAIRRRVCLIPFSVTISAHERDPDLSAKLRNEWPAILRWMINGALEWQRIGLSVPKSVSAASEEYMQDEDTLGNFIEEHLIKQAFESVSVDNVYGRFTAWQIANGVSKTWTKKAMSMALKERGYKSSRGTGGKHIYRGASLK